MAQTSPETEWIHKTHQYIPNSPKPEAHTLETWTPSTQLPSNPSTTNKYWIIYIHGGAWWRPMITASSFSLTVSSVLNSPHISGLASLNHRLSTPPPLPQFAEFVQPDDSGRNVKHPAYLNDVSAALLYLQREYGFGENYVLVGHSCGATLAFQLRVNQEEGLQGPKAVLGVEGIYDLKKLVNDHKSVPMYRYFTENAFGKDEEDWEAASPTTQKGRFAWEGAKVVAITQSTEDELVDVGQAGGMWDVVVKGIGEGRVCEKMELKGKHDEVWRVVREGWRGTQVGFAVERVLGLLVKD